jgi:hypothetical protein
MFMDPMYYDINFESTSVFSGACHTLESYDEEETKHNPIGFIWSVSETNGEVRA